MPKQLTNLDTHEISLVPRGANKKKFLVFKSIGGKGKMKKTLQELIAKADPKKLEELETILKDYGEEMKKDGLELDPRVEAAIKAVVRILSPFKDQISPMLMHEALHVAGIELEGGAQDAEEAGESSEEEAAEGAEGEEEEADKAFPKKKPVSGDDDEDEEDEEEDDEEDAGVEKEVPEKIKMEAHKMGKAAYGDAYKAHVEKLGYRMYPDAVSAIKNMDGKEEDVSKKAIMKADGSLDLEAVAPEMRTFVETIYKSHQDMVKKNSDLEKDLKTERENRLAREFSEKASEFKNLGANKEELATVLKSLGDASPELLTKVTSILKAADAQVSKGDLFKEYGSNQSATGGDMWANIEAAAMTHVAKSGEKTSKEDAVDKFLTTAEGQKMYAEYKAGRKGGI